MDKQNNQAMARAQIITAMIAFGTIGIFVKNIPLASSEIALYRAVIAGIVLFGVIVITGRHKRLGLMKKHLPKLFISGAAMGFNWILLFEAYNYTSVALSTLSYYFAPTIVIIASAVLLKERLTLKQIVCFIGSTAGLVMIIGIAGGGSSDLKGILYGLGAAFLYAVVIMCNKITGETDDISRTWMQIVFAAVILFPYVMFTGGINAGQLDGAGVINVLVVGVVHTGIMYCFYFSSLAKLRGQQAAVLSYIDPLVAVILSVLWLGEPVSIIQMAGGAFILIFALLNEIRLGKNPEKISS